MDQMKTVSLDSLFSGEKILHFRKGELLIRCDEETPRGIYFLKKGFVKMNTILPDGREIILNIFKPNSLFPISWVIADAVNKYNFQAMTPVEVVRQSKDILLSYFQNDIRALFSISRRVMIGTDSLISKIEHLLCGTSYNRIAYALYLLSRQFGERGPGDAVRIVLPITHQDIANLVAVSRETASITLEKLKKQKIITYRRAQLQINRISDLNEIITDESLPDMENSSI
jgi:CRP/FNR family transcriptional regulator